ncbi:MAG: hypothetical protein GKR98_01800 [Boseongicola sp.]|nr:MAG: hypothetical protein GKR98_01800 [Boseongicola sp.]
MRLLALTLILSGCAAAVQIGPAAPDPEPLIIGQGPVPTNEIHIYRPAEAGLITTVATAPALLLDNRTIGTCRFGQPLLIRVPKGNYTITALTGNGEENQWVTVDDGDKVYLRCGTAPASALSPVPRLDRVSSETAATEASL